MPETIDQAPEVARRSGGANRELYKLSPGWQKRQARLAAEGQTAPVTVSGQAETLTGGQQKSMSPALEQLLKNQSLALLEASDGAVEAAKYLVAVATGRKRGEQWRVATARDILDRTGVTGSTVERAQIAAQAAAGAGADIAPLLERIGQALALRQRAATAIDAVPQTPEIGQKSGTPGA